MGGNARELCRDPEDGGGFWCVGGDYASGFPSDFVTWPQFRIDAARFLDTLGFRPVAR